MQNHHTQDMGDAQVNRDQIRAMAAYHAAMLQAESIKTAIEILAKDIEPSAMRSISEVFQARTESVIEMLRVTQELAQPALEEAGTL